MDSPSRMSKYGFTQRTAHKKHSGAERSSWSTARGGICGGFFPLGYFTLLVSLQILRLLILGPWASSSPDSTPQKKWAQLTTLDLLCLSCSLLRNWNQFCKTHVYTEIVVGAKEWIWTMFVCEPSVLKRWINIYTGWKCATTKRFCEESQSKGRRRTYLQWRGTQQRCGSAASASPCTGKSELPKRPLESPRRRPPAAPGWRSANLWGGTRGTG